MKSLHLILSGLFAILQATVFPVHGQSPVGIGQWRTHYPYATNANTLAQVDTKVYCANLTALFYYDTEDQSFMGISKKDGLTGVNISRLGSYKSKELLIGYSDGNIDFLEGNVVTQFDDIQRSNLTGSKNINQFQTFGNYVFVATDYGLSIINMDRSEVTDSYINVSSDGSVNPFYASVLSQDGDSIFVASQNGILVAPYAPGIDLRDYTRWKLFTTSDGLPAGDTKTIGRIGNVIFTGVNNSGLYYFNGTQWLASSITGTTIRSITAGDQSMVACVDEKVCKITGINSAQIFSTPYFSFPSDGFVDPKGATWFVQANFGLGYYSPGLNQIGAPAGPLVQDAYRLKYLDSKVINCRGGLSVSYGSIYRESMVMYLGNDDVWKAHTIFDVLPSNTRDLLDAALHPASGRWYYPTFGWGLIRYKTDSVSAVLLDTTNSPLKMNYTTAAATEGNGTVWICTHAQVDRTADKPFLHGIDANGTWSSFKATQDRGKYPVEIVIDQQSNKWIRFDASGGYRGLMMFKEINKSLGTSNQIYFDVYDNTGALPDINVNTINVDQTGQVWIGTNQGICVFTNPAQIKSSNNIPKAYLPIVDGFPLFFDKQINCIKTDGANRKWVGTPDGVFLLSADGLQTIYHFNDSNSPITSNNVNTITINEQTGEVFFGTDKGVISYRGDATTTPTGQDNSNVSIFPNPVPRDFDGYVGISGLSNNSRVKITDIAGKLTYETPANGGTASWNLKDYTGRRATAGVYLIFDASDDGSQKYVGKIAVLD